MIDNIEIVVIPDIHGRTFWKKTIKDAFKKRFVFLGDYFDPYHNEGYTFKNTLDNFNDILAFKKENPDNVILLLGNHDLGYFDKNICSCRQYRGEEKETIQQLLMNNIELFDLCYEENVNGKRIIFSHAGITKSWCEKIIHKYDIKFNTKNDEPIPTYHINDIFHKSIISNNIDKNFCYLLSDLSFYRGGYDSTGSIIWADIREYSSDEIYNDVIQIVGHTQLIDKPVSINDKIFDLDVREAFYIDIDGNVRNFNTKDIISINQK